MNTLDAMVARDKFRIVLSLLNVRHELLHICRDSSSTVTQLNELTKDLEIALTKLEKSDTIILEWRFGLFISPKYGVIYIGHGKHWNWKAVAKRIKMSGITRSNLLDLRDRAIYRLMYHFSILAKNKRIEIDMGNFLNLKKEEMH